MVMDIISSGVLISHVALQLMTNTEEDQARPISSLAIHCLSQVKMSQVHRLNTFHEKFLQFVDSEAQTSVLAEPTHTLVGESLKHICAVNYIIVAFMPQCCNSIMVYIRSIVCPCLAGPCMVTVTLLTWTKMWVIFELNN